MIDPWVICETAENFTARTVCPAKKEIGVYPERRNMFRITRKFDRSGHSNAPKLESCESPNARSMRGTILRSHFLRSNVSIFIQLQYSIRLLRKSKRSFDSFTALLINCIGVQNDFNNYRLLFFLVLSSTTSKNLNSTCIFIFRLR